MENGLPKESKVESDGEAWSEDESVSSDGSHKSNMCNNALHVIGLHGSGDKISVFFAGLRDGKVGIELPHGPGHFVPRNV